MAFGTSSRRQILLPLLLVIANFCAAGGLSQSPPPNQQPQNDAAADGGGDGGGGDRQEPDDQQRGEQDQPDQQQQQLLFAQVLWRHGERSPAAVCPTDPNKAESWPSGWFELTEKGLDQQRALGQRLRQRYVDQLGLVSGEYNPTEVYVRSTDYNRTILSAMANLAGFFGVPSSDGNGGGGAPFIPVHTAEIGRDPFDPYTFCRREWAVLGLARQTPEYREMIKRGAALNEVLTKVCGAPVSLRDKTPFHTWMLDDAFEIELAMNRTLPPGVTLDMLHDISALTSREARYDFGHGLSSLNGFDFAHELSRLKGGQLLWTLVDELSAKRDCHRDTDTEEVAKGADHDGVGGGIGGNGCAWIQGRRLAAYSAHDVSLASLMVVLGLETNGLRADGYPHCVATVMLELWKSGEGFFVKVVYWPGEGDVQAGEEVNLTPTITGCEGQAQCPFDAFVARSQPFQLLPSAKEVCSNMDVSSAPAEDGEPGEQEQQQREPQQQEGGEGEQRGKNGK